MIRERDPLEGKAMEENKAGKEDGGGNLSWITKNELTDKVTCEPRSERNEGVRHVPIWAWLWLGFGEVR